MPDVYLGAPAFPPAQPIVGGPGIGGPLIPVPPIIGVPPIITPPPCDPETDPECDPEVEPPVDLAEPEIVWLFLIGGVIGVGGAVARRWALRP